MSLPFDGSIRTTIFDQINLVLLEYTNKIEQVNLLLIIVTGED